MEEAHTDDEPRPSGSRSRTGSENYEQKLHLEGIGRDIESPRERGRRLSENIADSPRDSPRERGRRASTTISESENARKISEEIFLFPKQSFSSNGEDELSDAEHRRIDVTALNSLFETNFVCVAKYDLFTPIAPIH